MFYAVSVAVNLGTELLGVRKGACSECQPFPKVDAPSYTPTTGARFFTGDSSPLSPGFHYCC